MKPLQPAVRRSLESATALFEAAMPGSPAAEYVVQERGINPHIGARFRLGYVPAGVSGWERFGGRLSVPNLCASGHVVGIKFRDLTGTSESKYDQPSAQQSRLFNLRCLAEISSLVVITEGELDAIAVSQLGFPAIGVPGASAWKRRHALLVEGYDRVVVIADADKAGRDMAKKIMEGNIPVTVVEPPGGCKDANEALVAGLGNELADLIRGEVEE